MELNIPERLFTLPPFVTAGVFALVGGSLYASYIIFVKPRRSPLHDLPGPKSPSLLWGHMRQIFAADNSVLHEAWSNEYGRVSRYKGFMNSNRLLVTDPKAIGHVLNRADIYQKPARMQVGIRQLFGDGLLVAEGDVHRSQRRIMNPAFGPAQVRALSGIFVDKANELRDRWMQLTSADAPATLDVLSWTSKATLDIIGLAGFSYSFDSLSATEGSNNELQEAFSTMFTPPLSMRLWIVLEALIPILRHVPTKQKRIIAHGRAVMDRIGRQLLAEKKVAAVASEKTSESALGRDLLSLLVKHNMSPDVPANLRLSDAEVLAQIPTFLIAGHETTSTLTTWALYALSLRPDVQERLRAELRACPLPHSAGAELAPETVSALEKLPLLDAVLRETLRLHAPVPSTIRTAVVDDVIPLSAPTTDRHGNQIDRITMRKGDPVFVPILLLNRSVELWGADAHEWNPDRWAAGPPPGAKDIPGVWGSSLSFLGGPHSCIGYRFAVLEAKVLLHALVSAFSFELGVPKEKVLKKSSIVTRPVILGEEEKGGQLPLVVTPVGKE